MCGILVPQKNQSGKNYNIDYQILWNAMIMEYWNDLLQKQMNNLFKSSCSENKKMSRGTSQGWVNPGWIWYTGDSSHGSQAMQQFRQAAATSISCSTSFAFDFKSTKKMRATASFETNSICLTIIRLKIETQVACVLTIPYKTLLI